MKGPADYTPIKKIKVKGHYSSSVESGGVYNEIEFLSAQSPASNYYNPDKVKDILGTRSPNASLNRDGKGPKAICIPDKKDDSPNPFTYKDVDNKWCKLA